MNKQRLAGILLIAGILVLIVGGWIFPTPNLYQETDIDARMRIVEEYKPNYTYFQIVGIISVTVVAVGYVYLMVYMQGEETARLTKFATAAIVIATIFIVIFYFSCMSNPRLSLDRTGREGTVFAYASEGFTWFMILAYFLYGTVFLRGDFSKWLAYFTLGFTFIILGMTFFVEKASAELLLVLPLIIGTVLLRRSKTM
jgi:hypothetical protein